MSDELRELLKAAKEFAVDYDNGLDGDGQPLNRMLTQLEVMAVEWADAGCPGLEESER